MVNKKLDFSKNISILNEMDSLNIPKVISALKVSTTREQVSKYLPELVKMYKLTQKLCKTYSRQKLHPFRAYM